MKDPKEEFNEFIALLDGGSEEDKKNFFAEMDKEQAIYLKRTKRFRIQKYILFVSMIGVIAASVLEYFYSSPWIYLIIGICYVGVGFVTADLIRSFINSKDFKIASVMFLVLLWDIYQIIVNFHEI